MIGLWSRISPTKRPDPALERKLQEVTEELEAVNRRDRKITQISEWLDQRTITNHFGDDVSITFRRHHA